VIINFVISFIYISIYPSYIQFLLFFFIVSLSHFSSLNFFFWFLILWFLGEGDSSSPEFNHKISKVWQKNGFIQKLNLGLFSYLFIVKILSMLLLLFCENTNKAIIIWYIECEKNINMCLKLMKQILKWFWLWNKVGDFFLYIWCFFLIYYNW
jgi:hypothetical protein